MTETLEQVGLVARPSLDDVFLRATGRRLEEDEGSIGDEEEAR